jgi:hypothetical protein
VPGIDGNTRTVILTAGINQKVLQSGRNVPENVNIKLFILC